MVNVLKSWLKQTKETPLDILKNILDCACNDYIAWAINDHTNVIHKNCIALLDNPDIQPYINGDTTKETETIEVGDNFLDLSLRTLTHNDCEYRVLWIDDATDQHLKSEKLHTSQEILGRHQSILDTLSQPVWMRDSNGALVWCNKAYGDLFNKTANEIISAQKEILIKQKDGKEKKNSQEISKQSLKDKKVLSIEGYGVISGERYYISITEHPRSNLNMTVGMLDDLTWQEEMSVQSERNISAYQTLFSSLQTAVALYDADQCLEFYNTGFSRLWQLDESWLNQRPKLGDILEKLRETRRLPEQADFRTYKKEWTDMFTKLIEQHDDVMVLPDGTVLRTQVLPQPMGGIGHVFEDVTSKLELESSYNTLMAVQKETIDNLAEGLVVYGSDGRLKLWNQTFQKLWKFNPEDLEGEPHLTKILCRIKDFFDEETSAKRKQHILGLFEQRKDVNEIVTRQDGMVIDFSSVFLPDGGMLLTYADVTDTIRVEGALREKNIALETAEQLKTDFLAKISYQLRTPLSAIIGFNEILDQEYFGTLNEKQKEYTAGMKDAGLNLKNLIDDILDLTSIEAGIICLETEDTPIQGLISSVQENTQDWADEKQIKIDISCPKTIGSLTIDRKRIRHAISHLMHNAINFTPEKGTVFLSAKKDKKNNLLLICVEDQGSGIAKNDLDSLFKPFEQKDMSGGAGLGLTLVKNIVELHNGSIDVKSDKGQGTKISLLFPLS